MSLTPSDFVSFLKRHQDTLLDEEEASPHSHQLVQKLLKGASTDLKFNNLWKFYLDLSIDPKSTPTSDFKQSIQSLGEFASVQEFCDSWNSLSKGDAYKMDSDLRLFKEDIQPLWEDPANKNGGRFIIVFLQKEEQESFSSDKVITLFLNLLVHMVCGQLGQETDVCGAGLSIRKWGLSITLWNRDATESDARTFLQDRLADIFPVEIRYQPHNTTIKNHDRSRKVISDQQKKAARKQTAQQTQREGKGQAGQRKSAPRNGPKPERTKLEQSPPPALEKSEEHKPPQVEPIETTSNPPTQTEPSKPAAWGSKALLAKRSAPITDEPPLPNFEDSDSTSESEPIPAQSHKVVIEDDLDQADGDDGEWQTVQRPPKVPKPRGPTRPKFTDRQKGTGRQGQNQRRDQRDQRKDPKRDQKAPVRASKPEEPKPTTKPPTSDSEDGPPGFVEEKPKSTWQGWAKSPVTNQPLPEREIPKPFKQAPPKIEPTPKQPAWIQPKQWDHEVGPTATAPTVAPVVEKAKTENAWAPHNTRAASSWADEDDEVHADTLASIIKTSNLSRSGRLLTGSNPETPPVEKKPVPETKPAAPQQHPQSVAPTQERTQKGQKPTTERPKADSRQPHQERQHEQRKQTEPKKQQQHPPRERGPKKPQQKPQPRETAPPESRTWETASPDYCQPPPYVPEDPVLLEVGPVAQFVPLQLPFSPQPPIDIPEETQKSPIPSPHQPEPQPQPTKQRSPIPSPRKSEPEQETPEPEPEPIPEPEEPTPVLDKKDLKKLKKEQLRKEKEVKQEAIQRKQQKLLDEEKRRRAEEDDKARQLELYKEKQRQKQKTEITQRVVQKPKKQKVEEETVAPVVAAPQKSLTSNPLFIIGFPLFLIVIVLFVLLSSGTQAENKVVGVQHID